MIGYFDGPRFRAKLMRHIENGKSLVRIERIEGIEVVHEDMEIPTDQIPIDLRQIGSIFLVLINCALSSQRSTEGASTIYVRVSRLPQSSK